MNKNSWTFWDHFKNILCLLVVDFPIAISEKLLRLTTLRQDTAWDWFLLFLREKIISGAIKIHEIIYPE